MGSANKLMESKVEKSPGFIINRPTWQWVFEAI